MLSLESRNIQIEFWPIGGRIISLRAFGVELLYRGDLSGVIPDLPAGDDWAAAKRRLGFRLFGGDKTWIAPEKSWMEKIPPLDLDAGRYAVTADETSVLMISPSCRETGLRIERFVKLLPEGGVILRETILNVSAHPVTRGIWNVSQVPRPFTVYFPGSPEHFRSYHLEDPTLPHPGLEPGSGGGMVSIPCTGGQCYKFGGIPSCGRCLTLKPAGGENIAWERIFDVDPSAEYAHGSAVEVFNSGLFPYGEVEIHSPLVTLAPGQRYTLEQRWNFIAGVRSGTPEILPLC